MTLLVFLTFVTVFSLFAWTLCKITAQSSQPITVKARTLPTECSYHEQLTRKYFCNSTPEELAELAAQRWAGDRSNY